MTKNILDSIILKCKQDDRRAQKQLFDYFAPKFMTLCKRYAGSTQQAEDFLQEGFIKVFVSIHQYKGQGSFEGWMRKVFVNTILRILSKESRIKFEQLDSSNTSLESDDFLMEDLEVEELLKMISRLPRGYKMVFNLHEFEGYSHAEIAKLLSIEEASVRSQLSKAKTSLRAMYERLYG
jgi:RNA polymerase sigma-70 factor (ECF subfamily)